MESRTKKIIIGSLSLLMIVLIGSVTAIVVSRQRTAQEQRQEETMTEKQAPSEWEVLQSVTVPPAVMVTVGTSTAINAPPSVVRSITAPNNAVKAATAPPVDKNVLEGLSAPRIISE